MVQIAQYANNLYIHINSLNWEEASRALYAPARARAVCVSYDGSFVCFHFTNCSQEFKSKVSDTCTVCGFFRTCWATSKRPFSSRWVKKCKCKQKTFKIGRKTRERAQKTFFFVAHAQFLRFFVLQNDPTVTVYRPAGVNIVLYAHLIEKPENGISGGFRTFCMLWTPIIKT